MATPSGTDSESESQPEPQSDPQPDDGKVIQLAPRRRRKISSNPISADWDTDQSDGTYSIESFYTAASDAKGHGEVISFKVPPHMKGRIANIVDAIPQYKNQSDFVRDACWHRERWLTEHLAECLLTEEAMMMRATEETEKAQAMLENLSNFVLKTEQTASRYLKEKDRDGFTPWAENTEEAAQAIRQPYRNRAIKAITKARERFESIRARRNDLVKVKREKK